MDKYILKNILMNILVKRILTILLVLSLLSPFILSNLVMAYDDVEDIEPLNFMKWKGDAQYYRDVYMPQSLFYPIEDWERLVCQYDLSTQLTPNTPSQVSDGGIYDTSVTVNAYKIYDWNTSEITYEISYYFHPTIDKKFTLKLIDTTGTQKYVIVPESTASSLTGAMGYLAFTAEENYIKAVLTYSSKTLTYTIINNRNITKP